jgi:hypothetical protein
MRENFMDKGQKYQEESFKTIKWTLKISMQILTYILNEYESYSISFEIIKKLLQLE